jgi:hypothetical protein
MINHVDEYRIIDSNLYSATSNPALYARFKLRWDKTLGRPLTDDELAERDALMVLDD